MAYFVQQRRKDHPWLMNPPHGSAMVGSSMPRRPRQTMRPALTRPLPPLMLRHLRAAAILPPTSVWDDAPPFRHRVCLNPTRPTSAPAGRTGRHRRLTKPMPRRIPAISAPVDGLPVPRSRKFPLRPAFRSPSRAAHLRRSLPPRHPPVSAHLLRLNQSQRPAHRRSYRRSSRMLPQRPGSAHPLRFNRSPRPAHRHSYRRSRKVLPQRRSPAPLSRSSAGTRSACTTLCPTGTRNGSVPC